MRRGHGAASRETRLVRSDKGGRAGNPDPDHSDGRGDFKFRPADGNTLAHGKTPPGSELSWFSRCNVVAAAATRAYGDDVRSWREQPPAALIAVHSCTPSRASRSAHLTRATAAALAHPSAIHSSVEQHWIVLTHDSGRAGAAALPVVVSITSPREPHDDYNVHRRVSNQPKPPPNKQKRDQKGGEKEAHTHPMSLAAAKCTVMTFTPTSRAALLASPAVRSGYHRSTAVAATTGG